MIQSKSLFTFITLLFLFAFSSVSFHACGTAPADQQITLTQEEYRTLKTNFDTLESTINNQLTTINELEMQLKIAKLSTSEQKSKLIEALNLIQEQKTQLTEARNLLQKQEQMLNEQKLSLAKAEIYLEQQKNEIKKAKTQQRNSKLLNILLGGTIIYLVAKD